MNKETKTSLVGVGRKGVGQHWLEDLWVRVRRPRAASILAVRGRSGLVMFLDCHLMTTLILVGPLVSPP